MPLIPNPASKLFDAILSYRNHRHDVLAANVANANTPGYRAFDVALQSAAGGAGPIALKRTHPLHVTGEAVEASLGLTTVVSRAAPRVDGNNVSLEAEFVKLTENRMMYQTAFELRDKLGSLSRVAREIQ